MIGTIKCDIRIIILCDIITWLSHIIPPSMWYHLGVVGRGRWGGQPRDRRWLAQVMANKRREELAAFLTRHPEGGRWVRPLRADLAERIRAKLAHDDEVPF